MNIQYAGCHTTYDDLVVRGRLDAGNYVAFYLNRGAIDTVGFNRGKEVRRAMPLIAARGAIDPDRLRDEAVDLRALQ